MARFDKDSRELITKGIDSRNALADGFLSQIPEFEQDIIDDVTKLLARLGTDAQGNIKDTKANAKVLAAIRKRITDIVKNKTYLSAVDEYIAGFTSIEDFTRQVQQSVNGWNIPRSLFTPIRNEARRILKRDLLGSGLDANVVQPILDRISVMILTGSDIGDVREALAESVEVSNIRQYLTRFSRDMVNQYDGAINQKIVQEFGLKWYAYVGSLIEDSRSQCVRWIRDKKGYLHESELPSEIAWAYRNGQGMIPGTNRTNFSINRGGYNCRHEAIPVSEELVPASVRARID